MKTKIIIILALFINALTVNAQYRLQVLDSLSNGIIKFASIQSKVKSSTAEDSKFFLKEVLKVENGTDFYLRDVQTDDIGMVHEKYQQTYYGIKVAFAEYIVHKDKEGLIVSINGDYGKLPKDIQRAPTLSFNNALEKATQKKEMKNVTVYQLQKEKSVEKYTLQGTDKYETVYVMGYDNQWHLAYKATLTPDNKIMNDCNAYISCETGDIVFVQSLEILGNLQLPFVTKSIVSQSS